MIWVGFIFVLEESALFFFQLHAYTVMVLYTCYIVSGMFTVG